MEAYHGATDESSKGPQPLKWVVVTGQYLHVPTLHLQSTSWTIDREGHRGTSLGLGG